MQTIERKSKIMTLSLKPELYSNITEYCEKRGCTKSWFMNKAAEQFLTKCSEDKFN